MNKIKEKIEAAGSILLIGHVNPDGDTVGAGLSLLLGLEKKYPEKRIDFVLQDKVPTNISFLKGCEKIKGVEESLGEIYELVIFVDSATIDRVGKAKDLVGEAFKINIDHHISNSNYGDINIVRDISSTSELMYSILEILDIEITLEMGEAIYLGIVNDTGNFAHSNVSENTFKVASKLMKIGVNNNKIVNDFFKTKSLERMRVLGKALSEMVFIENKKMMYFYLPYEYLEKNNIDRDDTEGVVEELINYAGSEVSLFLRGEPNGKIKGSLRSKHDVDVNKIAGIFGGGGHIKASGFTSELSANEIIKKVVENL
ncbi:bifunctional oligoribonuclease/PAP phosphatase NrnA [Cetobacterium sp. 8H]|uniref:DHH family phosphoesterase n=1 Tax=Cetobacterium sp. 8H TaxID=2759681 RepID=UPI00163B8E9C|nr:bifunctional oligoribonuclease/PAP phosphatase NrnA [Cetobacterium sp. 8H]MBC2851458.1 bifunctional oligoribonuclease/PAP phosphatase NrnA [Cetobacterium sp. 8H]